MGRVNGKFGNIAEDLLLGQLDDMLNLLVVLVCCNRLSISTLYTRLRTTHLRT